MYRAGQVSYQSPAGSENWVLKLKTVSELSLRESGKVKSKT
jgi:hypothetical protein